MLTGDMETTRTFTCFSYYRLKTGATVQVVPKPGHRREGNRLWPRKIDGGSVVPIRYAGGELVWDEPSSQT